MKQTFQQRINDSSRIQLMYVRIASLWEMAIKIRLESLSFEPGYDNLLTLLDQNGFDLLPVTFQHRRRLLTLPCIIVTHLTGF